MLSNHSPSSHSALQAEESCLESEPSKDLTEWEG